MSAAADQFDGIWQQCALVGDHLERDPVGAQRLAGQLRGEHSIGGAARARGAGSGVLPSRLSRSSTPVPPTASTRRIATVIQLGARRDQCLRAPRDSFAPPVRMISREVNSRPAIVSLDSAALHRC